MTDAVTLTVDLTAKTTMSIQKLQQADRGEQVTVTYTSPKTAGQISVTGQKTADDGTAAVVDTGEQYRDGSPRTLTVDDSGEVRSSGLKQSQWVGWLVSVDRTDGSDGSDGSDRDTDHVRGTFDTPILCPDCGGFMQTEYDPNGLPAARCRNGNCRTDVLPDDWLQRHGHWTED